MTTFDEANAARTASGKKPLSQKQASVLLNQAEARGGFNSHDMTAVRDMLIAADDPEE